MAGVIGDPVRHSLSPAIHNAAFEALGLDWVYVAFPVPGASGDDAVRAMKTLGVEGLSVTMPHKEAVAGTVDELTEGAAALGVCNCVFRRDGRLVGDSTDGDGFVRSLEADEGVRVAGRSVLVIGTGGAARSIIEAVGRRSDTEVVVVSRSPERAAAAAGLAPNGRPGRLADAADTDIVVNASPIGMAGGPDPTGVPIDPALIRRDHIVVDIVYEPRRTPLLARAEARGARTVNGVGMLVHQAALAFEHWTGHEAPIEAMLAVASNPSTSHPADRPVPG